MLKGSTVYANIISMKLGNAICTIGRKTAPSAGFGGCPDSALSPNPYPEPLFTFKGVILAHTLVDVIH